MSRNRDGWGVGFYQGADIALYRDTCPADRSPQVRWLEGNGPETTLSVGYIRHATQGKIMLANTGPYVRELNGRMRIFAHNGNLPGLVEHPGADGMRFRPVGETDSERAFCRLLQAMVRLERGREGLPPLQERLDVIDELCRELRRLGPANFLYADGATLFVHGDRRLQPASGQVRAPGLFLLVCPAGDPTDLLDEHVESARDPAQCVVLIASVPLSRETWRPLPEGELLAVEAGRVVARLRLPDRNTDPTAKSGLLP